MQIKLPGYYIGSPSRQTFSKITGHIKIDTKKGIVGITSKIVSKKSTITPYHLPCFSFHWEHCLVIAKLQKWL